MVELDGYVGQLLQKLDDLGIANNTIVVFMTDNGAEFFTWPDGGTTIFRGEKNTSWEGGYRIPFVMRWPGVIKPGTVYNDVVSNEDLLPTFLAAAGDGSVKDELLKGKQVGPKTFKVHLDGYNLLPWFKGEVAESRARSSSTGPVMVASRRSAMATGRCYSSNNAPSGAKSGRSRSCRCGGRG